MAKGSKKKRKHDGHCDGDCANCPPHYGYRYGRWYYGHGHNHGCVFGGNKGGGGPMLDMDPYYITALINLLGEVKRVYGTCRTTFDQRLITAKPHENEIIQVNVPTHYECLLTFSSGATISFLTTFDLYDAKQANIQLYGTKGNLYVPDPNYFGGKKGMRFLDGATNEERELPLEFDYSENSRCLGLADLAAAIEQGRSPRTSYLQTYHVLEVMTGVMKSAETGMPYEMTTHFERQAPMDPTLPHGVL